LLVALVLSLGLSSVASAADSLAPAGAPRNWLPKSDWVLNHAMPYDEQRLFRALHIDREGVRRYFAADKFTRVPTLAALARKRGIDPDRLARSLVDAWVRHTTHAHRRVLVSRAEKTLTQGHLMQHMLFHPFHVKSLARASTDIFGAPLSDVNGALRSGKTRADVGRAHGRSLAGQKSGVSRVLHGIQDDAVHRKLTPRSEARREVGMQLDALPAWLSESGAQATNPQADRVTRMAAGVSPAVCHLV
jgi:hypothetical protein